MIISDSRINQYIDLCQKQFGRCVERDQAIDELRKLVSLVKTCLEPENNQLKIN